MSAFVANLRPAILVGPASVMPDPSSLPVGTLYRATDVPGVVYVVQPDPVSGSRSWYVIGDAGGGGGGGGPPDGPAGGDFTGEYPSPRLAPAIDTEVTWSGRQTFALPPRVADAPGGPTEIANKSYVDASVASVSVSGFLSGPIASRPASAPQGTVYEASDPGLHPRLRHARFDGVRWRHAWPFKCPFDYFYDHGGAEGGAVDCAAAFQAAIDDTGLVDADFRIGGSLYIPAGVYRCDQTLYVRRWINIFGEGGDVFVGSTQLVFPAGKTGIVIDSVGTGAGGGRGDGSIVERLYIKGAHAPGWQPSHSYALGARVKNVSRQGLYGGIDIKQVFVATTAGVSGATEPDWLNPANGAGHYVSGTGAADDQGVTIADGGVVWTADYDHGVVYWAAATVRDCTVTLFGGDGIHICTDVTGATYTGANGWKASYCFISGVAGDGIYCHGGDSNAGIGEALNITLQDNSKGHPAGIAGSIGINDDAFLANKWHGCQVADCYIAAYRSVGGDAPSVFDTCYAEGGQGPEQMYSPTVVVGGLHGSGFSADSTAFFVTGSGATSLEFFARKRSPAGVVGPGFVRFWATHDDGTATAFGWLFDGSARNNANGDGDPNPYRVIYNPTRKRWDVAYANAASGGLYLNTVDSTTLAGHAGLAGVPGLGDDYLFGASSPRKVSAGGTWTSAGQEHKLGDRVERTVSSGGTVTFSGGYLGYLTVLAGTVGGGEVHRPYAPLEGVQDFVVTGLSFQTATESDYWFNAGTYSFTGSPPGGAYVLTLPAGPTFRRYIRNKTSVSLSFKVSGSSQTIIVGAGMSAIVESDGVDLNRVTADTPYAP